MGFKKWRLPQADPEHINNMISQTGIPEIAAQILDGRDVTRIEDYISGPQDAKMHDPFLMKDMDKAVERLTRAVENGEQIAVYGDYDCDGITATAMLYTYLEGFRFGGSALCRPNGNRPRHHRPPSAASGAAGGLCGG